MANKRDLKRAIRHVCSDLFALSAACAVDAPQDGTPTDVEATLVSILQLHDNFIVRVSHPEPGMGARAYYRALVHDFDERVTALLKQIAAQEQSDKPL